MRSKLLGEGGGVGNFDPSSTLGFANANEDKKHRVWACNQLKSLSGKRQALTREQCERAETGKQIIEEREGSRKFAYTSGRGSEKRLN